MNARKGYRMKKRVLVIEDEESIREYMCFILKNGGFSVFEAKNGTEGLDYFSKNGFDLVVTDMVMPDKDGHEIMKSIRSLNPKIPMVAISGALSYKELLIGAGRSGADAVIQKPFTESEFLDAIKRCKVKPAA
jgi:two-component system response regulator AtoC